MLFETGSLLSQLLLVFLSHHKHVEHRSLTPKQKTIKHFKRGYTNLSINLMRRANDDWKGNKGRKFLLSRN